MVIFAGNLDTSITYALNLNTVMIVYIPEHTQVYCIDHQNLLKTPKHEPPQPAATSLTSCVFKERLSSVHMTGSASSGTTSMLRLIPRFS